ncbi:VWA domain-containing protein [Desulfoluna spongiiphila]|uniref:VWA domain-containing protein n=1 Tax=Desulfoluna spongiiphila TaxID=419481 RepID=UPI001252602A|nr:VWA domain-containing protein [Desulfoluna spongiiphila]VVS90930.1 von willebrand factor type a [Desulfoluna spongiiphila]
MTFADLHMLYLIWLVPVVAAMFAWGGVRRRRILTSFASGRSRSSVLPEKTAGRRRVKAGLMVLSVLFLILALAGPRYGYVWQEVERKGVDIIVALDCSKSMLAGDVKPSRLERAKREIIDLLAMLEGDRIGLVAFAGEAFLQCPLTLDYSSFNMFLEALSPDYLPVGGTDLQGALTVSMEAFKSEDATDKAVILITDGESTDGNPDEVAKKAAELGIKVFTIGVGSKEGVPVPDASGGFKKNRDGSILLSKLDAATLKHMAALTGGSFVRSVAGDMDLDVIYTQGIRKTMEARFLESSRKKVWENRYQWFLGAAILCLVAYLGLGDARKNGAALMIALCLVMPRPARALDLASPLEKGVTAFDAGDYESALTHFIEGQLSDPDNPDIDFNIGTAYYRLGKFDEAAQSFERAARSEASSLKNKALYNLGNSRFKKGEVEKAIDTWENLLKASPEDRKTTENLAFAKKKLEEMKQQQKDQKGQKDPKGQGDKKEKKDGDSQASDEKNPGQQGQDGQDGKDSQGKDKDQQTPSGEKDPGKDQAGQQPPPPSPEEGDQQPGGDGAEGGEEDQAEGMQGKTGEQAPGDEEMQQAASALNRLKDKPGGVMMRRAEKRRVEKDW